MSVLGVGIVLPETGAAGALVSSRLHQAENDGVQVQPTAAQRHFISGTELEQNFRFLDAAEQYRLAIDEDQDFIDAYRSLARVFSEMAKSEPEYFEDALELYEQLEEKVPDDVGVKKNKAYVFIQLDEIEDAVATYEEILELAPEDCDSWGRLASVRETQAGEAGEGTPEAMGFLESAIAAYTKMTEVCEGGDEAVAYNKLGEIYYKAGETERASAIYDALIERDPENVEIYGRAGYLWHTAGKGALEAGNDAEARSMFTKAIGYFDKLLELDPERSQYRGLLADSLKRAGLHERAAQEYLKIIEEDPTKMNLYCNVGFTLLDASKDEQAIEMAMRAIGEGAPSEGCLYCIWGKGLEGRGNAQVENFEFDRAITTYTDAKAKFFLALGDPQFGDYAAKQITRQDQLIERAKQMKLKVEQQN
jgi:tetratricopeptide (TPR) repeat protein